MSIFTNNLSDEKKRKKTEERGETTCGHFSLIFKGQTEAFHQRGWNALWIKDVRKKRNPFENTPENTLPRCVCRGLYRLCEKTDTIHDSFHFRTIFNV